MESFERRDFVSRPGAGSDAVQAPLAFRDAVRGAKDQVQTIAVCDYKSMPWLHPGLAVFSVPAASKSSHDIHIALRCSPCRIRKILAIKPLPFERITL
jgi:hypothetical protein